jgi:carboxyl-terminal processing protease
MIVYKGRMNSSETRGKKPWWVTGIKIGFCTLGVVGAFMVGVGYGNGTIRFSDLSGQNRGLPKQLNYATIDQAYNVLKSKYDGKLDEQKLLDGLKSGLASATGDPYTTYLNAKDAREFNEKLQGTFSGIGAELGQDAQGNLIVVSPIDGFPASKAGLRPQDIIVEIDTKSTAGMTVEEAVSKIRGEKGTKVTLGIVRNRSEDLSFTITRDNIKIPSVKWDIIEGNVGYLEINQFGEDTSKLAQQAAREFKDKGVKGVVVDLRGNPGGLVNAAVATTSLWLPEGKTILQERRGNVAVSTDLSNGNNILAGIPTAVLIDAGSASAAEIMAGALKDHKAATLFGVKSFGKGSVQQVVPMANDTELKVTIARWYRPNGQNIDKKGIAPDTEVKMTDEDYKQNRDPQKDAAVQFIKK